MESNKYIDVLKDFVANAGSFNLVVQGNSMLPLLTDGDVVKIQACRDYKIGDIVGYYHETTEGLVIIIHRVIFVRKQYVLTKGDNNSFIDPVRVDYNHIIGKIELFTGEGEVD